MEQQKNNLLKKSLLGLIVLILITPLIQQRFKLLNIKPLSGYFEPQADIDFNQKNWLTGEFQNQKEAYLKENFGFSNWLVRLNNQVNYSFFNETSTKDVVIGK